MKRLDTFYPKFIAIPVIRKGKMVVTFVDKTVTIRVPRDIVYELLTLCTGELKFQEVVAGLSSWDPNLVSAFLLDLIRNGIIGNSHNLSEYSWRIVTNPTPYYKEPSDQEILKLVRKAHQRHSRLTKFDYLFNISPSMLLNLIENRRSTRVFTEEVICEEDIASMLWAAYGIVPDPLYVNRNASQRIKVWQSHKFNRHTVPSAGALYPLRVHLCLFRPVKSLPIGIYEVHYCSSRRVQLSRISSDVSAVVKAFVDQMVMNNAQGVIIISGSFTKSAEKYTNRSLLYVPLEAGHVAQNLHLAASERSIHTLELGGFLEEPMQKAVRLPGEYWPLITILFGKRDENIVSAPSITENLEVRWSGGVKHGYVLPFSMAFARLKGKESVWACGRAVNPKEALLKAASETYEWNACGIIPKDLVEASYSKLDNALDPSSVIRYHRNQYARKDFPFKPFLRDERYLWTVGRTYNTDMQKFVIADSVYFPFTPEYTPYTTANSSGCAAHPVYEEAVQRGALELIERDSFMIHWLNQIVPPTVTFRTLPAGIQKRIRDLQRIGFRVVVKDCSLDLTPVVLVFAQSQIDSFTTCAAASNFSVEESLDHALMEVESAVHSRMDHIGTTEIFPRQVRHTDEHGSLYEQPRYFQKADVFGSRARQFDFRNIGIRSKMLNWQHLLDELALRQMEIVVVPLISKRQELNVVRIFVPGLVPITFGYGVEPKGMTRLYDLPVQLGLLSSSKPYGKLQNFPHPYT